MISNNIKFSKTVEEPVQEHDRKAVIIEMSGMNAYISAGKNATEHFVRWEILGLNLALNGTEFDLPFHEVEVRVREKMIDLCLQMINCLNSYKVN
jgi:hydrogenase/urease accessory protein HupE